MMDDGPPAPVFAHSLQGRPPSEWEPLEKHLRDVAKLAAHFGAAFHAAEWTHVAGLWHDLGKYRPEFQRYLHGEHPRVEHAGLGAALAQACRSRDAPPLCFAIAGHHTGLANALSNESARERLGSLPTPLAERLEYNRPILDSVRSFIPSELRDVDIPALPASLRVLHSKQRTLSIEYFTRFLFSALIDADRLATADFYAQHTPALLHDVSRYETIAVLRDRLDSHIDALAERSAETTVNRIRADVLRVCREVACEPPGRFSLTVPTGGGKTLSAMSFALNHAHPRRGQERLRRVIVVIPYTSIIEQNAAIYRGALGGLNVVEHHSNLDEEKLEESDSEQEALRKLATENWDAPIIVTTSVQFFESLFSNHPSRCRKLHNLARSVIILDEVQTLPPQLLEPILEGLRELSGRYGCTIVFSTATPPALACKGASGFGLEGVQEIVPAPAELANRARRVNVRWEVDEPTSYETLAERIGAEQKVLTIVHRRRDARELAQLLQQRCPGEHVYHLSALMCPAHRLDTLKGIRSALDRNGACRVVATQLVEAGVDLDFPVVYRALAGVDSLAQAAGRCDREGRLTAANGGEPGGRMIVFRAPTAPPPGVLRKALESTLTLRGLRGEVDPFDPSNSQAYFEELYGKHDLDQHGIQLDRSNLDFATVAVKFRMIDAAARPVVVPYADAMERVERFRADPSRRSQRALQPFIVQVSPSHYAGLKVASALDRIHDQVDFLIRPFWSLYHDRYGLDWTQTPVADSEVFVQ